VCARLLRRKDTQTISKCRFCGTSRQPSVKVVPKVEGRYARARQRLSHRTMLYMEKDAMRLLAINTRKARTTVRRSLFGEASRLRNIEKLGNDYLAVFVAGNVYSGLTTTPYNRLRPSATEIREMSKDVSFQMRVPVGTRIWFKTYCVAKGTTMSAVLSAFIAQLKAQEEAALKVPSASEER